MSVHVKPQGQVIKSAKQKRRHSYESKFTDRKMKGHGNAAEERRKYLADDGNIHQKKRRFESGNNEIMLPKKFKLGGNIDDPLNLRSMDDEEVNRKENMVTPQSSPVPTPKHRHEVIEVLIPPNTKDPLNLLADVVKSRKKRNKKRKSGDISSAAANTSNISKDISSSCDTESVRVQKGDAGTVQDMKVEQDPSHRQGTSRSDSIVEKKMDFKTKPNKYRKKHNSHRNRATEDKRRDFRSPCKQRHKSRPSLEAGNVKFNKKNERFQYGNYNRYYGYRLADQPRDPRLDSFKREWFEGQDVLDLGCNVGFITLAVAKDFEPKKIIGIDIDDELIKAARRNIRHYLSPQSVQESKFPISMALCYGPIAAPPLLSTRSDAKFPNNVQFIQGNYVLNSDEDLEQQKEEYNVILCLSLTKWIHLNWGDDGLKRTFKRMFRQLKPNGKLILEAQGWHSYGKKSKLTETLFRNYQGIKLRPERFREYLLAEVGFSKCEVIGTPKNNSKGFQRPIYLFTKGSKSPSYSTDGGESTSGHQTKHPLTRHDGRTAGVWP